MQASEFQLGPQLVEMRLVYKTSETDTGVGVLFSTREAHALHARILLCGEGETGSGQR